MPQNNTGDNWSQLLSDFGIEIPTEKEQPQQFTQTVTKSETHEFVAETVRVGKEVVQSESVTETTVTESVESKSEKPKEKKSIFARFPKINIFGSAPKDLETITDGAKQSALGGKSFTGNTLEKTPVTPKHPSKEPPKKTQAEPAAGTSKQAAHPTKRPPKNETDSWSMLASQIGTLADGTPSSAERSGSSQNTTPSITRDPFEFDEPKSSGRQRTEPVSLFDEAEPTRSAELAALQNLLDEPTNKSKKPNVNEPAERSAEPSRTRGRGNNRRFDADLADDLSDETPVRQQRGRGSRYQNNDEKRYERPYREPIDDEVDDIIIEEEFKEIGADDNLDEVEEQPTRSQRGRVSRSQQDDSRSSGWRSGGGSGGNNGRGNGQQRNENRADSRNDSRDSRNDSRGAGRGRAVARHDIDNGNASEVAPFDSFGDDVLEGDVFEKASTVQSPREQRGRESRYAGNRSDHYSEDRFENVSENRYSERGQKQQPQRRGAEPEYDDDDAEIIVEDELDAKTAEQIHLHQNLPSWEDAIGDILAGNIARHRDHPSHNRNGRR